MTKLKNTARILTTCALLLSASATFAAGCDNSGSVKANTTTPIFSMGLFDGHCRPVPIVPQHSMREKPAHGKITATVISETAGKSAGRCAGRKLRFKQLAYAPDKGYRGRDKFTFRIGFPGLLKTCTIKVQVR